MMGINGHSFAMDRVDVTAKLGTSEIWEIQSAAMAHPFHMHGASFRILSNNGRPPVRLGRPRSRRAHPRGIDDCCRIQFAAITDLPSNAKSRGTIRMSRAVPALNMRRYNNGP
jgi:FtsP/CotA-like multicopper oxidase with cupredoxin domain